MASATRAWARSWLGLLVGVLALVLPAQRSAADRHVFLGLHRDGVTGVDGLFGVSGIGISPDGMHVYSGSGGLGHSLNVFTRGTTTGGLAFTGQVFPAGTTKLAVSPDGAHVYGADSSEVEVYERDGGTGAPTLVEQESQPGNSVVVSPDGAHVYVAAGNSLVGFLHAFSRDAGTKELTFIETYEDGVAGIDGLKGASDVTISPDLFVNNQDPGCGDQGPCFTSIQAAIDEALPGDRIQIQPGTYRERLEIRDKNNFLGVSHSDRIVIGRAEGAPVDSVILTGHGAGGGCRAGAVEIRESGFITISGLVITGFRGAAVLLHGGPQESTAVHIERNRIFGNGSRQCNGGVVIEKGNPDTLVVNNLIYANGGNGVELSMAPARARGVPPETLERQRMSGRRLGEGLQVGGTHYLIQNTIHGNGRNGVAISQSQAAILANNAVTANGVAGRDRRGGYGVIRDESRHAREMNISMLNNLICGNVLGELRGSILAGTHADNLTPTGMEALGVLPSPECLTPEGVYENLEGTDGREGTLDDDFTLKGAGEGMPSPAIDRGLDPRTLGLDMSLAPLLLADFLAPDVRPIQRDVNRPLDFDIGALELACDCFANCESCQIVINPDGTSTDQCMLTYDPATQCCDRTNGNVSSKELGQAFDVCPETRTPRPGFDPQHSADGCSAVPDRPLPLCPAVRFGCDFDGGEENCPKGIDLPCNNHDYCYQTCGRTQDQCDLAFFDDMIDVCNNMTPAQKLLCYDDCLIAASLYFDGVVVGGEEAHRNGQNRGCQCCQDVFPPQAVP